MATERIKRQIDRLLDEAEQAVMQRDWAAVLERAQDALALDPEQMEAKAFLDAAERAMDAARLASVRSELQPSLTSPMVAPALPTFFVSGRYQVKRFLGEGGKKKVYLANDLTFATFYSRRVLRGF